MRKNHKHQWKSLVVLLAVLVWLATVFGGYIYGVSASSTYYKEVAVLGQVKMVEELTLSQISFPVAGEVLVGISNNSRTEVGHVYRVLLYLNNQRTGTASMQWVAGEPLGTEHLVRFTSVDLSGVTTIGVEAIR